MANSLPDQEKSTSIPSKRIPIRNVTLSDAELRRILTRLQDTVKRFGEAEVAKFTKPDSMTEDQWNAQKTDFLENAYLVTTTVDGFDNKSTYCPTIDNVFDTVTPQYKRGLFATNGTSFHTMSGRNASNLFQLTLDFSSPPAFDSENPLSAPTPNASTLIVSGRDESWISTIESCVEDVLKEKRTKRKLLHRNAIYDLGLFLVGFPASFAVTSVFYTRFGDFLSSLHNVIEIAIYFYVFLLTVFVYRLCFGYARWLFPTMELEGSVPSRATQRKLLSYVASGLFLAGLAKLIFG